MPGSLTQEQLEARRSSSRPGRERYDRLGVGRLLDDLDRTLVELPQDRVLLEPVSSYVSAISARSDARTRPTCSAASSSWRISSIRRM